MSFVNKYTESATYSGGSLIFSLNDGLTYSVNIPVGATPSLSEVTSVGATTSNNIILTGTNSIQSNNGNGYFYFDDVLNQTLIGQNTPGSTYSQLRLSNASALLQSSQGSNNLRSITMNNSGIDISVQSSTSISKLYIDTSNVWIIGTSSFYKLPNTDGLSGQVLTTNGAGQASWATASSLLSSRLTAWDAYNTNGLVAQTSATSWIGRTIVGSDTIDVINGNGVSGNPTLQLSATSSVFRRGSGYSSIEAVIGGTFGGVNSANGAYSFVAGNNNVAAAAHNFVFGSNNTTFGSNSHQNIFGGTFNITGTSSHVTIINGYSNTIINTGGAISGAAILGGSYNTISGQIIGSVILGGQYNSISNTLSDGNAILGGNSNSITAGRHSVILGGQSNTITSTTGYSVGLGLNGITMTQSNTTYLNNLKPLGNIQYSTTNVGLSTTLSGTEMMVFGILAVRGGSITTTMPANPFNGQTIFFRRTDNLGTLTWTITANTGQTLLKGGTTGNIVVTQTTPVALTYLSGTWYSIYN